MLLGQSKFLALASLLPVAVERLLVGGLHPVDGGKGPRALVTPTKATRVGVAVIKDELFTSVTFMLP